MKITLTYVANEEKISKSRIVDGVEKGNKKYTSCTIRCKELLNPADNTKEMWINKEGFADEQTKSWNIGDEVDIELVDSEYNGQTYKKFKTLDKADVLVEKLNILHERLVKVEEHCFKTVVAPVLTPPQTAEIEGNPNATEEEKEQAKIAF